MASQIQRTRGKDAYRRAATASGGVLPTALQDAISAYRLQTDDLVWLFWGSSSPRGYGSNVGQDGATTANRYEWSITRRIRDQLVAYGYHATADAVLGNGEQGETRETYDGRFTESPAASWSQTSGATLGGHAFRATAVGAKLQFQPRDAWDTVDIYYQKFASAGTVSVKAAGVQIGTIDRNAAEGPLGKATLTAASVAAHAFEIELTAGTFRITGFRFRRSDRKQIELLNAGWVGSNVVDGKMSANFFNPTYGNGTSEGHYSPFKTMQAVAKIDLFCIWHGSNEWNTQTDIQAMVDRDEEWGDAAAALGATVAIMTPIAESGYVANNGAAYVAAQKALAAEKGWRVVDLNAQFGRYDAAGWWGAGDGTHLGALGHQAAATFTRQSLIR
jgi:hypothetical protein